MNVLLYVIIYPILAIALFFISNWLGKHSYSLGYHKIDFIVDREDSAAFNFSLKVLTPAIFIILISAILYSLQLDRFIENIYIVTIYSVLLRLFINLFMGRLHILDWKLQIFYAITISIVSYFVYIKLILPKKPLIPDFNTISNELWIIIGLFIFNIINKIELSETKKKERISKYIFIKYKNFSSLYDKCIQSSLEGGLENIYKKVEIAKEWNTNNNDFRINNLKFLQLVVYSIMIFEDFNRPKNARLIENFVAKHSPREITLGIMQAKTDKLITDEPSISLGIDKIINSFYGYLVEYAQSDYNYSRDCIDLILEDYNLGEEYSGSVKNICDILSIKIYQKDFIDIWFDNLNTPIYEKGNVKLVVGGRILQFR